jgi:hypothetical protein
MRPMGCQDIFQKKIAIFCSFFLDILQVVKRKLQVGAKKNLKKMQKNLDTKAVLPHSLTMQNEFALMSAECEMTNLIALSPVEIMEANAWFDMVSAQFDEIEDAWDRLAEYVDNL